LEQRFGFLTGCRSRAKPAGVHATAGFVTAIFVVLNAFAMYV
jgi:hypothetical protein